MPRHRVHYGLYQFRARTESDVQEKVAGMKDHGSREDGEDRNGTGAVAESKRDPVMWTPELDAIVRAGYARGWQGALEAINAVQQLHPKWRSYVIWQRAKQLGFSGRYVNERPPWSAADDGMLMDFAQEQSVGTLARWLHRSKAAVRWRFSVLGESARIRDNYTQEELARDLRVSPRTVRRWVAAGALERRDGRITHESLEEFCQKHGSEINFEILDREMQRWLVEDAGFVPGEGRRGETRGVLKHLQRIGVCPLCRREVRGNAHARHLKACARKNGPKSSMLVREDENGGAHRSLFP